MKQPELLKQWENAVRRKATVHSVLCSKHFTEKSYQIRPGALKKLLRSNAVPTIFNFSPTPKNPVENQVLFHEKRVVLLYPQKGKETDMKQVNEKSNLVPVKSKCDASEIMPSKGLKVDEMSNSVPEKSQCGASEIMPSKSLIVNEKSKLVPEKSKCDASEIMPSKGLKMDSPSRNIEIKARIGDIDTILFKAAKLSGGKAVILNQKDTFYHCPKPGGRLKLREENGAGTLISYSRPDIEGPKLSQYKKTQVKDLSSLSAVLEDALGIKGVVKKKRLLLLVDQTRIHIDQVEGLGDFMELEVVLKEGQSPEEGQVIAQHLMDQLGIQVTDLLPGAYLDMLTSD